MTDVLSYNRSKTSLKSLFSLIILFTKSTTITQHFGEIHEKNTNIIRLNDLRNKESINLKAENSLKTHGNSILRISYSYLHNMNDAEDVLQDTLIQLIKNAPNFENVSHEKAWLMRVAINLSKNKIKYQKKRETSELDDNLIGEENSDLAFVWEAVNDLSIKYREIIHLYYHEGYSTTQIAKLLQKNEATVRSLLHRGRGQLMRILKEVYDFEE